MYDRKKYCMKLVSEKLLIGYYAVDVVTAEYSIVVEICE